MTESKICTCPSGDGSLRWPCPKHPAVEQAGGDERAAFEAWMTWLMDHVYGRLPDFTLDDGSGAHYVNADVSYAWTAWQARAALAQRSEFHQHLKECADEVATWPSYKREALTQPSPKCVKCGGTGEADSGGVHPWGEPVLIPCDCDTEKAEAERPEAVAFVKLRDGKRWRLFWEDEFLPGDEIEALMTVAQHERIVGALRAEITQLRQHKNDYMDAGQETYRALQNEIREREAEIARLDGLVSGHTAERDAALARVAELERQEPVGWEWIEVFVGGNFDGEEADNGFYRGTDKENILPSIEGTEVRQRPLYAAPVAQTQHSVPVAREQLERLVRILDAHNYAKDAEALMALLAAAPGKEVPQAWLDVQAERSRQVEAECWTPEHDDAHSHGQMARAAACYALAGSSAPNDGTAALLVSLAWPWDEQWWKPTTTRRDLVKACALALAEIERLDRAAASQGEPSDA
ncbi:hypothetical protein ACV337_24345 [Pseudomonas aeruginosa]